MIIGDPRTTRTDALIVAYAKLVDRLGGRYLTAEDVGTTQADMDLIRTVTPYVTGVSESLGGSGDPSPATAWGVFHAMKAVAERLWGDATLEGRHVAIAGIGKVGSALARHLADAGCQLTLADVRGDVAAALADELGARTVDPDTIHRGRVRRLEPVRARRHDQRAHDPRDCGARRCAAARTISSRPTPTASASRPPACCTPRTTSSTPAASSTSPTSSGPDGYNRERAWKQVETIHDTVLRVFAVADDEGITPAAAADHIAEQRSREIQCITTRSVVVHWDQPS